MTDYFREIDENKEILINKMYSGEYVKRPGNIGYEIINLIKDDEGRHFIYVLDKGTIGEEHDNQIDTIILARESAIPNTLEILGQAYGLTQIIKISEYLNNPDKEKSSDYSEEDKRKNIKEEQENFEYHKNGDEKNEKTRVEYDTCTADEIFENNDSSSNNPFFTFFAEKVIRPKKPIYLSFDSENNETKTNKSNLNIIYLNTGKRKDEESNETVKWVDKANREQKMYFRNGKVKTNTNKTFPNRKEQDQSCAYKKIKKMLLDKSLWDLEEKEKINKIPKANELENTIDYSENNFMDIIDKKNAELTYSNLFKYILDSDKELFKNFVTSCLKIKEFKGIDEYNVQREEHNIDLLLRIKGKDKDGKEIKGLVVIENKIKSGINGIKYDINGNEISNQLEKYYAYVNDYSIKTTSDKTIYNDIEKDDDKNFTEYKGKDAIRKFYIFIPDYNNIEVNDKNEKVIACKEDNNAKYKVIKYSELYEFFNGVSEELKNSIKYYNEFLYALSKHKNPTDNSLEIEQYSKFLKRIKDLNRIKEIRLTK